MSCSPAPFLERSACSSRIISISLVPIFDPPARPSRSLWGLLAVIFDPSARSARINSRPDFRLRFRSCPSISVFVTTLLRILTRLDVRDDSSLILIRLGVLDHFRIYYSSGCAGNSVNFYKSPCSELTPCLSIPPHCSPSTVSRTAMHQTASTVTFGVGSSASFSISCVIMFRHTALK